MYITVTEFITRFIIILFIDNAYNWFFPNDHDQYILTYELCIIISDYMKKR